MGHPAASRRRRDSLARQLWILPSPPRPCCRTNRLAPRAVAVREVGEFQSGLLRFKEDLEIHDGLAAIKDDLPFQGARLHSELVSQSLPPFLAI